MAGPALLTVSVYVRLVPWFTGFGEPIFVMLTSACDGEATSVVTVAVLLAVLGSLTLLVIFGEFVMVVPEAVPGFTFTTSGNCTIAPTASVCPEFRVQVTVPVLPTAVFVHAQPVGAVTDASVVLAGIASVNVTVVLPEMVMAVGPLLVTDCV